jgi:hypothetical protein
MEVSIAENMSYRWEENPQSKEQQCTKLYNVQRKRWRLFCCILLVPTRLPKRHSKVLTILLTNHYVVGRAGGKNDREGVTQTTHSSNNPKEIDEKVEKSSCINSSKELLVALNPLSNRFKPVSSRQCWRSRRHRRHQFMKQVYSCLFEQPSTSILSPNRQSAKSQQSRRSMI